MAHLVIHTHRLCHNFFPPTCSKAKSRQFFFIYSNNFCYNFHLSESSFTCRTSGLTRRLYTVKSSIKSRFGYKIPNLFRQRVKMLQYQSSWNLFSCVKSFGLIPFRIWSVRTNFCQSEINLKKQNFENQNEISKHISCIILYSFSFSISTNLLTLLKVSSSFCSHSDSLSISPQRCS